MAKGMSKPKMMAKKMSGMKKMAKKSAKNDGPGKDRKGMMSRLEGKEL